MKLYADTPVRRTRQLVADVFVILWVATWIWATRQVHDTVALLTGPANSLTAAGDSVHGALTGAGDQASRIPVVGDAALGIARLVRVAGMGGEGGRTSTECLKT